MLCGGKHKASGFSAQLQAWSHVWYASHIAKGCGKGENLSYVEKALNHRI